MKDHPELCANLHSYGLIVFIIITLIVARYRRRRLPLLLYLINSLFYAFFYFNRCRNDNRAEIQIKDEHGRYRSHPENYRDHHITDEEIIGRISQLRSLVGDLKFNNLFKKERNYGDDDDDSLDPFDDDAIDLDDPQASIKHSIEELAKSQAKYQFQSIEEIRQFYLENPSYFEENSKNIGDQDKWLKNQKIFREENDQSPIPFEDDDLLHEKYTPHSYLILHDKYHKETNKQNLQSLSESVPYWLKVRNAIEYKNVEEHKIPGIKPSVKLLASDENLMQYEIDELSDHKNTETGKTIKSRYDQIWFTGRPGIEKIFFNSSAQNNNFDVQEHENGDRGGHYRLVDGDHILYRYEIVKYISAGVYGQVLLVNDHAQEPERKKKELKKDDEVVDEGNPEGYPQMALKIMNNHTSLRTRSGLEYYSVRYIHRHVKPEDKPFVVGAYSVDSFRNHQIFTYELLGESLWHRFHRQKVRGNILKSLAWDILEGLAILDRIELIHNDLKPDNILFTGQEYPSVKVIDYGLGCYRNHKLSSIEEERVGMKCPRYYVMTRYYRAPEVMLGLNYTTKADMWSFGCIVGELYRGLELIYGEKEVDQMAAVMEIIGLPPVKMIEKSWRKEVYFKAVAYKTEGGFQRTPYRKTLKTTLKTEDTLFLDFMSKIMVWEPEKRYSPLQAMNHPWLRDFARERFAELYRKNQRKGYSRKIDPLKNKKPTL